MSDYMTELMPAICMGIPLKSILSQGAGTAAAENKKHDHLNDAEAIFSKSVHGLKNTFQKGTFSPVLFG